MSGRAFLLIAGVIFGVVTIAHLLRIFMALPVTIGGWMVPMWVSWVAVIVGTGLSYAGLRFARSAPGSRL
jgi:hypothetical protein